MGEEARTTDYRRLADGGGDRGRNGMVDVDDGCKDRVIEWEHGLPDCVDLTPLCQALVPPELASAFSITPEPSRTVGDVTLASRSTLSNLGGGAGIGASSQAFSTTNNHDFGALDGGEYGRDDDEEEVVEDEEAEDMIVDRLDDNDGSKKLLRKSDLAEEADSVTDGSKTAKRQRLVWTPQLHKRFVDVVSHLGIKNAVPKTIMQLMNVEGLTRENVASHLQKYRLYLKRMQRGGGSSMIGNSDSGGMGMAGLSETDQLFASTPATPHGMNNENGSGGGVGGSGGHAHAHRHKGTYGSYGNGDVGNEHMPMPMPMMMGYGVPGGMVGMPVYGMYGGGHPGVPMDGNHHHHWYGPMVPHPPQSGASNDK